MSNPSEIKSKASKISSLSTNVSSSQAKVDTKTNGIDKCWKGEASKAYLEIYRKSKNYSVSLTSKARDISNKLNTLAAKVQRAEEEERAKRAAAKSK